MSLLLDNVTFEVICGANTQNGIRIVLVVMFPLYLRDLIDTVVIAVETHVRTELSIFGIFSDVNNYFQELDATMIYATVVMKYERLFGYGL